MGLTRVGGQQYNPIILSVVAAFYSINVIFQRIGTGVGPLKGTGRYMVKKINLLVGVRIHVRAAALCRVTRTTLSHYWSREPRPF